MGQPIIPFAPLQSRDGTIAKDALLRNGFVEVNGKELSVFKRPGLYLWGTGTGTGAGQGMTDFIDADGQQRLFVAQGGTLFAGAGLVPSATVSNVFGSGSYGDLQSGSGGSSPLIRSNLFQFGGKLWSIGSQAQASNSRFTVHYTDDGTNWTLHTDVAVNTTGYPYSGAGISVCVHKVSGVPRVYVIGPDSSITGTGQDKVWYTEDMVTWTLATSSAGLEIANRGTRPMVVSHTDGKMYAFHYNTAGTQDQIFSSTDGVTWTSVFNGFINGGAARQIRYIPISLNGNLYTVAGYDATVTYHTKIFYSQDNGVTWGELGTNVLPENIHDHNVVVIAGIPYIVGYLNGSSPNYRQRIYRGSADLTTWTLITTWTAPPTLGASWNPNGGLSSTQPEKSVAYFKGAFYFFYFESGGGWTIWKFSSEGAYANVTLDNVVGNFFDFGQNYGRTQLVAHSEQALYVFTVATSTLAEVTDANYPGYTTPGFVVLDDYGFVMDPDGNIYNSANADFTTWPGDYIAAQFENDGGVALAKQGLYIVALGYYTTELFFDAGNATGSPLSPVQQGVFNIGCAHGRSIGQVENSLIWVAQSKGQGQATTKGRFIAKLDGTSYAKISTPDIDRILDADPFVTIYASVYKINGHSYYHLMLKSSGISLVFDLNTEQWYVWSTRRDSATVTPSNVVTANGTATATITHSYADGDVGVITGFTGTHTNLNGTFNMIVPSASLLHWKPADSSYSGTATGTGTATSWAESYFPVVGSANYENAQLLQDIDNGNLYELDPSTYQDNSIWLDFKVRLNRNNFGSNNPKFMAWADFVCDRNSGNLLYRHSDDDCQTFTYWKKKTMDQERTRFNRLGRFHGRTIEYRVTDNVAARIKTLETQLGP